jgi:hypothetical protein
MEGKALNVDFGIEKPGGRPGASVQPLRLDGEGSNTDRDGP